MMKDSIHIWLEFAHTVRTESCNTRISNTIIDNKRQVSRDLQERRFGITRGRAHFNWILKMKARKIQMHRN